MNLFLLILQDSSNIAWLGCALFLAGILESLLWRTSLFNFCNYPIQPQWFGENKKWRGLITLPLTHLLSVYLFQALDTQFLHVSDPIISFASLDCLSYGLLTGLVFNLSELPNSFIKRRLSIPSGDESNVFFYFMDHIDSTYGTLLLWYIGFCFPLHLILTGLLISPLLFIGATWIRRKLHLKT